MIFYIFGQKAAVASVGGFLGTKEANAMQIVCGFLEPLDSLFSKNLLTELFNIASPRIIVAFLLVQKVLIFSEESFRRGEFRNMLIRYTKAFLQEEFEVISL
jgi:hypothetical protein